MLWLHRLSFLSVFLLAACTSAEATELVIHEYLLVGAPDISTDELKFQFAEGDQKEVLASSDPDRDLQKQIAEYNNHKLAPFGYRQEQSTIYKGDERIASNALFIHPISVNASGTNFIGEVEMFDGTYLFTRGNFEKRPWPAVRDPYAYVADHLLSGETGGQTPEKISVNVFLDDQQVYQSQIFEGRPTYGPMDGPWSYDGHWALVLLDGKGNAARRHSPVHQQAGIRGLSFADGAALRSAAHRGRCVGLAGPAACSAHCAWHVAC